jgi:hypothetical protein
MPRQEQSILQPPRQKAMDTANTTGQRSVVLIESPRRPSSKRSPSGQRFTPELPRAESTGSMRSRGSSSSMQRTVSSHSNSSMKRSMSREFGTPTKKPKQFIVHSKASRLIHRQSSSTQLARTPSSSRIAQGLQPFSRTDLPKREKRSTSDATLSSVRPTFSAAQVVRQQLLNMSQIGNIASPPPRIRRSLSDGNGIFMLIRFLMIATRLRRSSSEGSQTSQLTRPRRSSNLARDANVEVTSTQPTQYSCESDDDDDEDSDDHIEIPVRRRPLLEEPELPIPVRRISERSPPIPPTLQLRRPSQTQKTSPRLAPISGLSAISNSPPVFNQLMQPGPPTVAPPSVTSPSTIVKDLPYVPHIVGSHSSVRERINMLQNGRVPEDAPSQADTTSSSADLTASPSDERTSTATTTGSKAVSLEKTRYALSPEAHDMIRRLSNGPPGMLLRPSSPSPPAMPSGWVRPERSTRTMQRQVMYRDFEQQAFEQQQALFSPIARDDGRSDYFNPGMNLLLATAEDDPFLNTLPQLNRELRRIENELNQVKKYSDPMTDALQRLHARSGASSPIHTPTKSSGSMFSLGSSFMKRFSPEKRDTSESLRKNSLPSRLRESTATEEEAEENTPQDGGVKVFAGESESKLREVTRQLWFSWPSEKPNSQETEDRESDEKSGATEQETPVASTSASPVEARPSTAAPSLERRSTFGSGLRSTWGSALALAGLKPSS